MFISLLCCILPPLISCALSALLRRERRLDPPLLAVSFCMDGLFIQLIAAAVLFPLDRAGIELLWDFWPVIIWGKTALVLMLLLGVLTGLVHVCFPWQQCTVEFRSASARPHLSSFLLLLAACALRWGMATYQIVNLEEIWFYLHMPLEGTTRSFTQDILLQVILPAMVLYALGYLTLQRLRRVPSSGVCYACGRRLCISLRPPRVSHSLRLLCLLAILIVACDYLKVFSFFSSRIFNSPLIEECYVDPLSVTITFPENKRNLIWICMESAETTAQDTANGGALQANLIPEMTQLAEQNVSFSQSDLVQGASIAPACGWTIAGIVAQTAGLPLKLYSYNDGGVDNAAEHFVTFLPGATTLGDILHQEGYRNVFMAGSDFTFGGRRLYAVQHGNYEIWDLLTAREEGKIPEDYYQDWGFQDWQLYAFAKEKLAELASGSQPFHLALLTVDTHIPGYTCPLCRDQSGSSYEVTTSCASAQVADFVVWCQQQPFYENTTIVITGDHASMNETAYAGTSSKNYEKHRGDTDRLVYNAFINAATQPVQEKNRLFCTLDFFPTMLSSIGVQIAGERLGLGTNLFSDAETLCEQYGYEYLFKELNKKSLFYNSELLYPKQ